MNEVHAARTLGALSALGPRTELAAARTLSDLRHGAHRRQAPGHASSTTVRGPRKDSRSSMTGLAACATAT
jgi:hypothetical protein